MFWYITNMSKILMTSRLTTKSIAQKKAKREREAVEMSSERKSTLSIRLLLKEFCMKFLEHSYNSFMKLVKDNVIAKRSQEHDDSYYLWILRFFMAFNRSLSFKVDYISETLNMQTFHYILKQLDDYHEHVLMCKRGGWQPWQRRLHFALQAYKELLMYLSCMDQANDNVLLDASSMMKNNVFYHEEYRNVFIRLFRHFDKTKQTKKYLTDLVDTFHIFLRLLEQFCGKKGSLIVKSKKKVVKKKKKKRQTAPPELTAEQLEELWENELAPSLSAILQGNEDLPENTERPFDISSDVPVEEQSAAAMVKIQDFLRLGNCGQAVALLKASRECWPNENGFGASDVSPEEEFGVVRNILFQELERPIFTAEEEEVTEENENEVMEEELEETRTTSVEREFHLKQFLMSLATSSILSPYNHLLANFQTNSSFTNHAIIKMMHRVALDLKFPEMLFQLSTFITFKKILQLKTNENREMIKFANYIVKKFVEAAEQNPKIYVEVMFWKGTGDCYEISNREDERKKSDKHREKWSFEDEEELKDLYNQFNGAEDVVGEILKNISSQERTRRQITNKLVRLKIVENSKQLPKPKQVRPPKWTTEQTEELHRIFDEMRGTIDPLGNIMNALSFPKSKQAITKHLLETGKVSDRSELKKKRQKKKKDFNNLLNSHRMEATSDASESSDGSDNEAPRRRDNESDDDEDDDSNGNMASNDMNETFEDVPLQDMVKDINDEGFDEQLTWLQSRLNRAAQSREEDPEDEWCAMPLLTMTEDDEHAIENKSFKGLLKKLKLKPPADEQEAFWRIPAALSPRVLRQFAEDIEKARSTSKTQDNSESKTEKSKGVKRPRQNIDSDNESVDNDGNSPNVSKKSKKKQLIYESDESDSDNDDVHFNGNNEPTTMDIDDSIPLTKLLQVNGHESEAANGENVSMDFEQETQEIDDEIPLTSFKNNANAENREKELDSSINNADSNVPKTVDSNSSKSPSVKAQTGKEE